MELVSAKQDFGRQERTVRRPHEQNFVGRRHNAPPQYNGQLSQARKPRRWPPIVAFFWNAIGLDRPMQCKRRRPVLSLAPPLAACWFLDLSAGVAAATAAEITGRAP